MLDLTIQLSFAQLKELKRQLDVQLARHPNFKPDKTDNPDLQDCRIRFSDGHIETWLGRSGFTEDCKE